MSEAELWAGVSVSRDQSKKRERDSAIKVHCFVIFSVCPLADLPYPQGPVKEAMMALRKSYRRQAREFIAEQSDINGSKHWALATYRVTRDSRVKELFYDCHNESRRGSMSRGRSKSTEEDSEDEMEEGEIRVTRVELISWPWLWAQEVSNLVGPQMIWIIDYLLSFVMQ